jgi:hypothetical protein
MNIRICAECDCEFNVHSPEKRRVGGLAIHCAECSEEHAVKSLGFASGDGKMASLSIVQCASQRDAEQLKSYWHRASGMDRGKSCQMHTPALTMPGVSFRTVTKSGSMNHKGKA